MRRPRAVLHPDDGRDDGGCRVGDATMITADYLRSILSYDPDTGIFRWRASVSNRSAGALAGTYNPKGYLRISINDRAFSAHRLAWLYVTGKWPNLQIDHVNRNPADNRIANLQEATPAQNSANKRRHKENHSGLRCAYPSHRKSKPWASRIGTGRRYIHLGHFDTPEEAHAAYVAASAKFHGDFSCID